MVTFDSREKYCISLMIARGGSITTKKLKDIITEFRGEYEGLSNDYVKSGKAIQVTLDQLEKRNFIKSIGNAYEVDPIIISGFVKENYSDALRGLEINLKYKQKYELEFDAIDILDSLKPENFDYDYDYEDLLDEINKAFRTYQTTDNYRSVITSCGRCVEMMINTLVEDNNLEIDTRRTGYAIDKINDPKSKFMLELDKDRRNYWRFFFNGCKLIYDIRNRMGAHVSAAWGLQQVANSCLLLTMYFVDFYVY